MSVQTKIAQIEMAHGAGGKATRRLIEGIIVPALANPVLETLSDAALLTVEGTRLASTADAFVVKPLQFPGGSIGSLAVHGTINDLAVSGARPLVLMVTLILEAGLSGETLEREIAAMAAACRNAGVSIVGGDTKVVEHGLADGMYVSTFGIGAVDERLALGPQHVRAGDRVLLSGPIGDHGITILLARGELELEAPIESDSRSLVPFVEAMSGVAAAGLRWMRDPTRGGVATALNELARDAQLGILLAESAIPLRDEVRGACEILGLDPLHIANEGQLLAVVAPEFADDALRAMQRTPGGEHAAIIGEIVAQPSATVIARTPFGGTRVVDMLVGDPLPRIC
jgi:hydrogenase expression/formation protein HypE